MAGFVDIQAWLVGQLLRQRLIGNLQTSTDLGDLFGEETAANVDLQHVTNETTDGGIGAMAGALLLARGRLSGYQKQTSQGLS